MNETGYACGVCASVGESANGSCPECGATTLANVDANGYVVGFTPGSLPCPDCGRVDQPIQFRGWSRTFGFVVWVREQRRAAYLCPDCSRKETTINLLLTALFGWWSFPSFFFYGPRSTYHNWRAVSRPPSAPGDWGAIHVEEFLHIRQTQMPEVEVPIEESPLRDLSESQRDLVLRSIGLYELLQVPAAAPRGEIHAAYRSRAKEFHPDMRDTSDHEVLQKMILINQAWEVLGTPNLRAAYDWLEANR